MKKLTFIASFIVFSSFLIAPIASGATGDISYTPLEPIGQLTNITQGNLPDLLNAVFKILFSLGGLLAVGELVAGGIMYMTSETPVTLGSAKSRIWAAFYGLLILAGSYLILNTINPDLLKLNLTIQTGAYTTSTNSSNPIQTTDGNSTTPGQKGIATGCEGLYPPSGGAQDSGGAQVYTNQSNSVNSFNACATQCQQRGGTTKPIRNGSDSIGPYTVYRCIGYK
jgi:hypothetical protein